MRTAQKTLDMPNCDWLEEKVGSSTFEWVVCFMLLFKGYFIGIIIVLHQLLKLLYLINTFHLFIIIIMSLAQISTWFALNRSAIQYSIVSNGTIQQSNCPIIPVSESIQLPVSISAHCWMYANAYVRLCATMHNSIYVYIAPAIHTNPDSVWLTSRFQSNAPAKRERSKRLRKCHTSHSLMTGTRTRTA